MYRYVPVTRVKNYETEAAARGVSAVARSSRGFLTVYAQAGNARNLPDAWRRRRDAFVKRHLAQAALNREQLYDARTGQYSRRGLALLMWAYDPKP